MTLDSQDQYFSRYHPNFYNVYKPEENVTNAFKRYVPKILNNLCRTYGFTNYGVIDAYQNKSDAVHLSNKNLRKHVFPPRNKSCGLISLEMNPTVGGGHWAAWVYFPGQKHIYLYDSMMKGGKSTFFSLFREVMRKYFDEPTVSSAPCATCTELKGIRIKSESRQPTGGFVSGEKDIVADSIKRKRELSGTNYNRILGYRSQHQFCYAESLMFIEDVMKGNNTRRACPTGEVALRQVKKFIANKLEPNSVPNSFRQIYNPKTRRINTIT